ncbi:unnamed protein product [Paramecium octaurelia]|uniref:Uncharacterized protein n=1 Tax=Paramecium octaurelia TaxID=43137 RepID=A0A8S1VPG5_PAROT|nr:unnamed protein product [Paramecium octaurelia]
MSLLDVNAGLQKIKLEGHSSEVISVISLQIVQHWHLVVTISLFYVKTGFQKSVQMVMVIWSFQFASFQQQLVVMICQLNYGMLRIIAFQLIINNQIRFEFSELLVLSVLDPYNILKSRVGYQKIDEMQKQIQKLI